MTGTRTAQTKKKKMLLQGCGDRLENPNDVAPRSTSRSKRMLARGHALRRTAVGAVPGLVAGRGAEIANYQAVRGPAVTGAVTVGGGVAGSIAGAGAGLLLLRLWLGGGARGEGVHRTRGCGLLGEDGGDDLGKQVGVERGGVGVVGRSGRCHSNTASVGRRLEQGVLHLQGEGDGVSQLGLGFRIDGTKPESRSWSSGIEAPSMPRRERNVLEHFIDQLRE